MRLTFCAACDDKPEARSRLSSGDDRGANQERRTQADEQRAPAIPFKGA
jgi:hypothetical protein